MKLFVVSGKMFLGLKKTQPEPSLKLSKTMRAVMGGV